MKNKFSLLLLIIFGLGIFLRLYDVNWDQGYHLHPDERFLTMVGNALKFPSLLINYFNPYISSFNPANNNFTFFVYGLFPITINKLLALAFNTDTYADFTIQGRIVSAFFDAIIILLIFKTVEIFEIEYTLNKKIKYYASFFYAISVLPIQLSHFFAVDTFLNMFMFLSFYSMLKFWQKSSLLFFLVSSISFGLAISCKLTGVFILPLNIFLLGTIFLRTYKKSKKGEYCIFHFSFLFIVYFILAYLVVRLADPYMFASANILDVRPNSLFIENLRQLKSWEGKDVWFPPAVQWMNKTPIIFSLTNLVMFGIGLPYFMCFIVGIYLSVKRRQTHIFFILCWIILFFLYQSTQFVKTMRYFIFLYPFIAIFSGIGLARILHNRYVFISIIFFIILLIWPLSFMSIYTHPHSRVTASEWIYNRIPNNSTILSEHWDDALPISSSPQTKTFTSITMQIFDPDTNEKWQKIHEQLKVGDYLILSSNRGWGSIPTVPEKYPETAMYYKKLFSGKLGYKKIAEITSYPSLAYLGIPFDFPDDWSEEAFTVYDHPKVIIFKNKK